MGNKNGIKRNNEKLVQDQLKCLDLLYDFNQTRLLEKEKRSQLLKEMFSEIGDDCYIEPPLRANWGGKMFILVVVFMLILILLWLMMQKYLLAIMLSLVQM